MKTEYCEGDLLTAQKVFMAITAITFIIFLIMAVMEAIPWLSKKIGEFVIDNLSSISGLRR